MSRGRKAPDRPGHKVVMSGETADMVAAERDRISAWLKAKALETEELLNLAADRADPDVQQERRRQAHQTRAIIAVLGIMVEKNELPLRGDK